MIDGTDKAIIQILEDNARASFLDVAKQLKISESTARKRIHNLESEGIIKKYSAIIEPVKVGYGSVALVGIDVISERFLSVAKALTEFDNVKFVATCTGDHMLMVEIWMEKPYELRNFISEKIAKLEGVIRTCPAIINEKLKG
ncbi:Lrp/AsnC family transcriptional regulator [Candidatus Woesearchaeota archaeon]|nr:Lrp/AsnC family transcriptional regulator [Candidatus Woesearchaeota archaeon]